MRNGNAQRQKFSNPYNLYTGFLTFKKTFTDRTNIHENQEAMHPITKGMYEVQ